MAKISLVFIVMLSWSRFTWSLDVIYDTGYTVSAQTYYENIYLTVDEHERQLDVEKLMHTPLPKKELIVEKWQNALSDDSNVYPVRHSFLTPGRVASVELKTPIPGNALFVMGNDKDSLLWLKKNARHLVDIKAFGCLVSVDSHEQYARIKAFAKELGLTLVIYQGTYVFEQMKLQHYPAIIYGNKIYQ